MFYSINSKKKIYRLKILIAVLVIVTYSWSIALVLAQDSNKQPITSSLNPKGAADKEVKLLSAIKYAEDHYGSNSQQMYNVLWKLVVHYRSAPEKVNELFLALERMIEVSRRLYGTDHPKTLSVYGTYGLMLKEHGQFDKAEPIITQALELIDKKRISVPGDTLRLLYGLAELYQQTTRYTQAVPILERAIVFESRIQGKKLDPVLALLNFAIQDHDKKHFSSAIPIYERALELAEQQYGKEHKYVVVILNNLGSLYFDLNNFGAALPLFERRLAVTKNLYAKNSAELEEALFDTAYAYKYLGRFKEAADLLKQGMVIHEKSKRDDDLDYIVALKHYGESLSELNLYSESIPVYLQSIAIREKVQGSDHPDLYGAMGDLGDIYRRTKQYSNALKLLERMKNIAVVHFGKKDPRYGESFCLIALVFRDMTKYEDALVNYQHCLDVNEKHYGMEHLKVATVLNGMAVTYSDLGKYREALTLHERALSIREDKLQKNHRLVALSLNNISAAYFRMNQHNKALEAALKSMKIQEKLHGKNSLEITENYDTLSRLYTQTYHFDKAIEYANTSLVIRSKLLGDEHLLVADAMVTLANIYVEMSRYAEALVMYKQAYTIKEKLLPSEHLELSESIHNIAYVNRILGNNAEALRLYKQSLNISLMHLGISHPDVAIIKSNIAVTYEELGQYGKAIDLNEEVLAYRFKQGLTIDAASSLNNLGILYQKTGQYAKALYDLKRCVDLLEEKSIINIHHTATCIQSMALVYDNLGDKEKSIRLYERVLEMRQKIYGEEHIDLANVLINLAIFYSENGDKKKALLLAQRGVAMDQKLLPESHPDIAWGLNALGYIYSSMHQYDKALEYYQRSLKMRRKVYGSNHPILAGSFLNIGTMYGKQEKYQEAMGIYNTLIALTSTRVVNPEVFWKVQFSISRVYQKLNDFNNASIWGKESVNTIQNLRAGLKGLDKTLQSSFVSDKRYVYTKLADLLIAEGRISEAQAVLQMLKEQELYDSLQRASKTDPRSTRIELTGLERKRFAKYYELQDQQAGLGKERAELERKQKLGEISATEKKRLVEIINQLLPPLHEAMLVFLQNLQKQSDQFTKNKAYRQGESQFDVVETNLQKAMSQVQLNDPEARIAALQYVVTDNRLSILLSTPNNPPIARQIEFDGKTLGSEILKVRELLIASYSSANEPALLNQQLKFLYKQLIEPIVGELKTLEIKTLILVPNDVLRYIPFAALYDGKRYLIQNYTLTLFNEAVKKDFTTKPAKTWQLAAMGLSLPVENLPALTNVREELNAVAIKSGMKGKTYLDNAFTHAVLKDTLNKNFNILHLASHFEFVAGRPDASRLFLGDKSSLYLGDIARENMRFDNFSLVTFSACETGLGGGLEADGREMESLGALVQNQGARAVMATLWKVADSRTSDFMRLFYRYYHDGSLSKAQALRKAQLRFIKGKECGITCARPYFWAPFVLMGDWR